MSQGPQEKFNMRFIRRPSDQAIFIRREDVVSYIRDAAATEDTDTRTRLEHMADQMAKLGE